MIAQIKPSVKGFLVSRYFWLIVFTFLLFFAGVLILVFADFDGSFFLSLLLIAFSILADSFAFAHARFNRATTTLYFDEDELVYETGIVTKTKKKMPIHTITDTAITRTFLQRIFGGAALRINTGGSAAYEITMDGLNNRKLEEFHNELYKRVIEMRQRIEEPGFSGSQKPRSDSIL